MKKQKSVKEQLRYNPNFELTEEVLQLIKYCFHEMDYERRGSVKLKDIDCMVMYLMDKSSTKAAHEDWTRLKLELFPNAKTLEFEEFCRLIEHWRDVSPVSLEQLYNSWLHGVESLDFANKGEYAGFLDTAALSSKPNALGHPQQKSNAGWNEWSTIFKSFIAGGVAGIISKSCLAPIDRIKIIFQVSNEKFTLKNAVRKFKQIRIEQGAKALFRGNSATVLRVMPYAGIQHSSFDFFRRLLNNYNEKQYTMNEEEHYLPGSLSKTQLVFAGSLAGGLSVLCTYPLDILRARLVVQQGKTNEGIATVFKGMYQRHGISAFSRGLAPTLLGVLPYTGIGFALNEYLKFHLLELQITYNVLPADRREKQRLSTFSKFSCSYFAACIAQSVTYPLDTIRRRMQTEGHLNNSAPPQYTTMLGTARMILKQEGHRGLFKGLSVNWLRSPIATGISLTAYDALKEAFRVERI